MLESIGVRDTDLISREELMRLRRVALHYTGVLSALRILEFGLISRTYAHQHNLPFGSEQWLSVQEKNDRPEWISVSDSDKAELDWSQVMPAGSVLIVIPKERVELIDLEAQHRLRGESWIENRAAPKDIELVIIPVEIASMKIQDFFDSRVGDNEWESAYRWYETRSRGDDIGLQERILGISRECSNEVDREMPTAYWLMKGEEANRRLRRRVVESELLRESGLSRSATVRQLFEKHASGQKILSLI